MISRLRNTESMVFSSVSNSFKPIPCVCRWMRWMHSKMSPIRIFQFLGGMDRLSEDAFAQFLAQRFGRDQIHFPAEQFFEVHFEPRKLEQADRSVEIHQQIDVAAFSRLIAGD